jgi:tetratricopeptide (TPR) repeat protein
MKFNFVASILVFGLTISLSAIADDAARTSSDIKRAAAAYDQGRERYRDGEYVEAAEQFEAADDAAPSAEALRLSMLSRKEAGQMARALTHAALALSLYPANAELVEEAQALIDAEGEAFGRVKVTCDSPCELTLDNRLVPGEAAQERLIFVEPGSITMRASWSEGRTETETTDVYSEGIRELDFYASALAAKEPTTPVVAEAVNEEEKPVAEEAKKRDGWHPAIFWTGFGTTLVSGGVTVFLGINAKNNPGAQAVTDGCVAGDIDCDLLQQGRKNQAMANTALVITGVFGAFTITSAFLTDWGGSGDKSSDDEEPKGYDGWNGDTWSFRDEEFFIQPTLSVGNGASLGATGTF